MAGGQLTKIERGPLSRELRLVYSHVHVGDDLPLIKVPAIELELLVN